MSVALKPREATDSLHLSELSESAVKTHECQFRASATIEHVFVYRDSASLANEKAEFFKELPATIADSAEFKFSAPLGNAAESKWSATTAVLAVL